MSDSMILVEANLNNTNSTNDDIMNTSSSSSSIQQQSNSHSESKPSSLTNANNSLNTLNYGNMSIEDVYSVAKEFLRAKEGTKAVQLSYDDRNLLYVLNKQIKNRKLEEEKSKVGFLDLVGKDRLQLWESLGDLSRQDAMQKYIELVAKSCPHFHVHIEAHKRHLEELEQQRLKQIEEEKQRLKEMSEIKEKKLKEEDLKLLEENKKRREEIQRKQIQEALNQQTHPHFKAYAEQQHPNNTAAQEELIKQLQEQHFEQYMNQVYQQQLMHQQQQAEQLRAMRKAQKKQEQLTLNGDEFSKLSISSESAASSQVTSQTQVNISLITENESNSKIPSHHQQDNLQVVVNNINNNSSNNNTPISDDTSNNINNKNVNNTNNENSDDEDDDEADDEEKLPPISAASMLTRKDIKEFKESVRRDNDAIIKVGSGETVTVRVPTHEDGRLIFWEFATDYYDIGFGLYFEWSISPSSNVTVHVSDSSEEEEGDEDEDQAGKKDIEKGDKNVDSNKPPCDEIIPIFRRDCHEEVYAGSHLYPGRGVYLLKFDNSFSLWRSKTLYYRVYYSK